MKKCPICNEMNEDDRDTCKKCHGSLDFKIYRAEEKDEEKELDIKKKYPSCYHCGYSTPKLRNGLCIICRRKKIALKIVLFFFSCSGLWFSKYNMSNEWYIIRSRSYNAVLCSSAVFNKSYSKFYIQQ